MYAQLLAARNGSRVKCTYNRAARAGLTENTPAFLFFLAKLTSFITHSQKGLNVEESLQFESTQKSEKRKLSLRKKRKRRKSLDRSSNTSIISTLHPRNILK